MALVGGSDIVIDTDEFLHPWPADCPTTWKENYYWNLADRSAGIWGFQHVSFVRTEGMVRFAAFHMIDGQIRAHRSERRLDAGDDRLSDGILSAEIVEPLHVHRVRVDAPEYRLDLTYQARFAPFSYAGRKIAANQQRIEHLRLKRYEQGMRVTGNCLIKTGPEAGKRVPIDALGHRDHSWGRRDESKIDGWNWAAVQLPRRTVNITRSFSGDAFNVNGFISTEAGNVGVCEVDFETLEFESDGRTPVATRYRFVDDDGNCWHLRSRRFSDLFASLRRPHQATGTVIFENFADYVLEETGETGWGIDEYQRRYAG